MNIKRNWCDKAVYFERNPFKLKLYVATLALGSQPKQGLTKVQAKSEARKSHFMLSRMEECERMNPHAPKWAPTLGVRILMDFRIFRGRLQGSNLIGLKSSLYH
jgi:hypothetical protein